MNFRINKYDNGTFSLLIDQLCPTPVEDQLIFLKIFFKISRPVMEYDEQALEYGLDPGGLFGIQMLLLWFEAWTEKRVIGIQ